MIGFDFDGTIAATDTHCLDRYLFPVLGSLWGFTRTIKVPPTPAGEMLKACRHQFVVITARPEQDRWYLSWWLKLQGFHAHSLIMIPKVEPLALNVARFKAAMLESIGISIYVEDNPLIRSYLGLLVPCVRVVSPQDYISMVS